MAEKLSSEHQKRKISSVEELLEVEVGSLMHEADDIILGANDITDEHRTGLKLAAEFMRSHGLEEAAHDLLNLYNMEVLPTYDLEDSEFIQRMRAANININPQGYLKVGEGKDAIRYPMIMLSGDIMRFEIMFQKLKHDIKNELQSENN